MNITPRLILLLSIVVRIGFFVFGLYQDAYMTVKYTDIDYLVFSDAAQYVYQDQSPYKRETYRYTPLLAWMLVPNSYGGLWYHFGKVVFMGCDLITGFLVSKLLQLSPMSQNKLSLLSSIWLLNPMVITISTRGSSESVLTVFIMMGVFLLYKKWYGLSGIMIGLAIHFKIYPVIYLPAILLYLGKFSRPIINLPIVKLMTWASLKYLVVVVITVGGLNLLMFQRYGMLFIYNSYIYHFTRLDHRHNFSVYNVLLYYKSSVKSTGMSIEKYAFVPQLLLSSVLIPLKFARRDLISCLFVQTCTFVAFNKVMTSQYFIWFLIFLPHYISVSSLHSKGVFMVGLWCITQGIWLYFAYNLEFLGENSFDNLLYASCGFFLCNCWLISEFISDLNKKH